MHGSGSLRTCVKFVMIAASVLAGVWLSDTMLMLAIRPEAVQTRTVASAVSHASGMFVPPALATAGVLALLLALVELAALKRRGPRTYDIPVVTVEE